MAFEDTGWQGVDFWQEDTKPFDPLTAKLLEMGSGSSYAPGFVSDSGYFRGGEGSFLMPGEGAIDLGRSLPKIQERGNGIKASIVNGRLMLEGDGSAGKLTSSLAAPPPALAQAPGFVQAEKDISDMLRSLGMPIKDPITEQLRPLTRFEEQEKMSEIENMLRSIGDQQNQEALKKAEQLLGIPQYQAQLKQAQEYKARQMEAFLRSGSPAMMAAADPKVAKANELEMAAQNQLNAALMKQDDIAKNLMMQNPSLRAFTQSIGSQVLKRKESLQKMTATVDSLSPSAMEAIKAVHPGIGGAPLVELVKRESSKKSSLGGYINDALTIDQAFQQAIITGDDVHKKIATQTISERTGIPSNEVEAIVQQSKEMVWSDTPSPAAQKFLEKVYGGKQALDKIKLQLTKASDRKEFVEQKAAKVDAFATELATSYIRAKPSKWLPDTPEIEKVRTEFFRSQNREPNAVELARLITVDKAIPVEKKVELTSMIQKQFQGQLEKLRNGAPFAKFMADPLVAAREIEIAANLGMKKTQESPFIPDFYFR